MQTSPPAAQPDRRSVITLSTLLIAAIIFAIFALILAPRFFAGEFRGSYHFWLIASRLVPWIGAVLLVPALIFARTRQFALTALMLILSVTFFLLGNRGAMQLRLLWDAGDIRYYTVSDHLYLPPFDSTIHVYVVECDAHDLHCHSTPLPAITHSSWVDPDRDENGDNLLVCQRLASGVECDVRYLFLPGVPVYPVAPPD